MKFRIRGNKKKCHNCNGKGFLTTGTINGQCFYCRGKGYRINAYGRDGVARE